MNAMKLMNKLHPREPVISISGMILSLAVSFALERWLVAARTYNSQNFQPVVLYASLAGIHLLLAAVLLTLAWYINVKTERNLVTALVFLMVGSMLTLYPIFFIVATQLPQVAALVRPSFMDMFVFGTIPAVVPPFLAVIGVWGLLRKRELS
jgi:hypothetical protein